MKKILTSLLFLIFTGTGITTIAQTSNPGKISGKLQDGGSKEAVGFATISLFTTQDSVLISGTAADENGRFLFEKLPANNYFLKIMLVGFTPKNISDLRVSAQNPSLDLGTITLISNARKLSEIEIFGQRNIIEYGLDKQVINVAKDLFATGGTASDALKNAPSVAVDIDGNVSVRGSANVTVLIDGKNSGQTAQTILSQTPASAIEKIEVITNPSAKYDAEGMGGIINIILKKEAKAGLNGNIALNLGTYDNYNASLNLNYHTGKLNFFTGYDFQRQYKPGTYALDRSTTVLDAGTASFKTTFLEQRQSGRRLGNTNIPKAGFDYQLSNSQLITASVKSFRNNQNEHENVSNLLWRDAPGSETFYMREGSTDNLISATDLALNYRKTFANKRRELTASAVYSFINGSFNRYYIQQNVVSEIPVTENEKRENFLQAFNLNPFYAQADYIHPVGEKGKVETGAKHSQRILATNFRAQYFDYTSNEFVTNLAASNEFGYEEYVTAAYANFSNSWKKFSYQAGFRAEQSDIFVKDKASDSVYEKSYLNFFPSVFLSQEINENNKVQINYSRRLNRPNYEALNPFVNPSDPLNIWSGNPRLKPEYIDAYEASYIKFWNSGSLTNTAFFRKVHNVIQQVRYTDAGGVIAYNNYVNLDDALSYGLEISGAQTLLKWWKLNGNVSAFNYKISGKPLGVEANSSKFSWLMRLNSNFNLPRNLSVQVSVNYRSPQALAQGTRAAIYNTDVALKKDVFKKKAAVTLRVSDVFNTLRWNTYVSGEDLTYDLKTKRQSRLAILGFSYRIGNELDKRRRQDTGSSLDGMF